jgi:hypothetical protein
VEISTEDIVYSLPLYLLKGLAFQEHPANCETLPFDCLEALFAPGKCLLLVFFAVVVYGLRTTLLLVNGPHRRSNFASSFLSIVAFLQWIG